MTEDRKQQRRDAIGTFLTMLLPLLIILAVVGYAVLAMWGKT